MSPLLAPFTRPFSTSREDTSHLTRFKHAFSVLTSSRKHDRPILQSQHEKSFDDLHHHHHHYSTHSTLHTYMSNIKTKIRRMNSGGSANDTKGLFSFRPLDGRRSRFLRSSTDNNQFILSNAQTFGNDSTDHKLIRMFISDSSPRASISSRRRRSSFGSATSNNSRNLLSVGTASRVRRRYSMAGSELTVASEDLTAREFAEHCGISVYPEEEEDGEEPFASGISILVQQHRNSSNPPPPQSTVMSSTRSTKSKISIMEDSFWTPLANDFEEPMMRLSSDSIEAYMTSRPDGCRPERRNSLITFAEVPNVAKHKLQGQGPLSKQGIRSGRHSAPIPIPKPIFMQQSSALQYCTSPSQIDSLSNSSHSTDSSLALSYSSFTTRSTASSISVCPPSAIPIFPRAPSSPNPEKICSSFEAPIFATIMNERQPNDPSTELVPIVVKKGRFEVTIGNAPAPDLPSPTSDGAINVPSPTDENFVVFQRRKYRPESPSSDGEDARRSLDERRSSVQVECL